MLRKLDSANNFTLPKSYRDLQHIEAGDYVEFFIDDTTSTIILIKYQINCLLCNNSNSKLKEINGKKLCADCIIGIKLTDI